jgi:hypothetical protein
MAGYGKVKEAAKWVAPKKKKKKKVADWDVDQEVGVDLPEDKSPKKEEKEKPEKYSKIRQHLNKAGSKIRKAWTMEDHFPKPVVPEVKGEDKKKTKKKKITIRIL